MTMNWLLLLFGAQGSIVGVIGAEHNWFISALMLCNIVTPIIAKVVWWANDNGKQYFVIVGLILTPLFLSLIPQ